MGWSWSTDKTNAFTYAGRAKPPAGWGAMWGDPSIASNQQTGSVYIANLGGSSTNFGAGTFSRDIKPPLDGFCVARSPDAGRTFPDVRCFKRGQCSDTSAPCTGQPTDCGGNGVALCLAQGSTSLFYDGSTLVTLGTDTFFSSVNADTRFHEVWRAQNDSLNFQPLSALTPFGTTKMAFHPRLRAFGQRVYIAGIGDDNLVRVSFFDGQAWSPPRIVSNPAIVSATIPMNNLSVADEFSFDVGLNESGASEVRTVYLRRSGTCSGTGVRCFYGADECGGTGASACTPSTDGTAGSLFVEFTFCPADLPVNASGVAQCDVQTLAPAFIPAFDFFMPAIKYGSVNRTWQAVWLGQGVGTGTPELEATRVVNRLGVTSLIARFVDPQTPCTVPGDDGSFYWGDYNDLIWLGAGAGAKDPEDRFLATFSDSRAGCRFHGEFDSDVDVGVATFR